MNDKELIAEIRENHQPQSRGEAMPMYCAMCAPVDYPCDAARLADALEARQPSDEGEYILRLIETIKQTGGSVEVSGVKIMPCDEFGRTAAVPDAAPDGQVIIPIARIHELRAAKDAALDAVARVREMHRPTMPGYGPKACVHDGRSWPCQTIAALDGAPKPAGLPVEGESRE